MLTLDALMEMNSARLHKALDSWIGLLRVHDQLQRRWRGERCPIADAVVFADGRVVKVDYRGHRREDLRPLVLNIISESDLATVFGSDGAGWADIVERDSVAAERGVRFSCGETSWGSEGYVACSAGDDDLLQWIAVFEGSNPFERLHLDANFVAARSSHGTWWSFLRAARLHGALEEIDGSEEGIPGSGFRRKYRCKQCAQLWLLEVLFDHGSESISPLSNPRVTLSRHE